MNTNNHPITIKDIAKKFKCSPSTVSRALNNHPVINYDRRLMSLPDPPDAIFGVNDYVSIAAMQVIIEMGFSIPTQVAIVGFDNAPFSAYLNPSLSSVNRSSRLIGEEAARLFLSRLDSNITQLDNIILPPELIIRGSTLR